MRAAIRQILFNNNINTDIIDRSTVLAYSFRKLQKSYIGAAIRVRRSLDNLEQDIGYKFGVLDTDTLLSFCGSGSGFLSRWYDCSGNGNHAFQNTPTSQPQIVINGLINLLDNKPSVLNTGATRLNIPTTSFSSLTAATEHVIFRQLVNGSNSAFGRISLINELNHVPFSDGNAYISFFNGTRFQFTNYGTAPNLTLHTTTNTGSALTIHKNNVLINSFPTTFTPNVITSFLGCEVGIGDTNISEYILTSSPNRLQVEKFNKFYSII